MKRSTPQRIQDIKEQIEFILKATKNVNETKFYEDFVLQAAVIRWLEVIGEAAKYVPNDIKNKHPDIPWKQMAGMRDVGIHDYASLEYDQIWKTVTRDIPVLKKKIDEISLEE